ncbi:MAG TPA: hypothetical protein VJU87_08045, partial [Gemmatimonadaceae bacterium]|nr:hypothetical protein [Gemmatimonadaceae bacterium]
MNKSRIALLALVASCQTQRAAWDPHAPLAPVIHFSEAVPPRGLVMRVIDARSGQPLSDVVALFQTARLRLVSDSSGILQQATREKLLMDSGWKFHLGNEWGTGEELINLGVSTGPARQTFDDSSWPTINLPHDWAVALPFDSTAPADHG